MQILGHGIDMVETARVARMVADHGGRFLDRCFTQGEQAYVAANPARKAEHLAGRFAAKEAILKVLGTGWSNGIAWTEAEVVREASGRPTVRLHGKCAQVAAELGITQWHLSITHTGAYAMASAIGLGGVGFGVQGSGIRGILERVHPISLPDSRSPIADGTS